jgi:hypothetical protein
MRYERPDILTLDAPSIIEAMGPAQAGYKGDIKTPSVTLDSSSKLRSGKHR